jgi:ABC-2 type transport system permease protein
MSDAFSFLIVRTTGHSVRARLKRLRSPRYAIGAGVGLVYFWMMFGSGGPTRGFAQFGVSRDAAIFVGTGLLFVLTALGWVWTSKKGPVLGFTAAEVQYLFPAPITRRQLIVYRIVRVQINLLFPSLMFAFLSRPSGIAGVPMAWLGFWLALGVIGVHSMGVSLSRSSLGSHGLAGWTRQWMPLALLIAVVSVIVATIVGAWPQLTAISGTGARIEEAGRVLSTGAAGLALWPIRTLVRLPMSTDAATFGRMLGPVLLMWVLSAVWVIRSDAAFEDASADQAERVARMLRGGLPIAKPVKSRRPLFTLGPVGRPETALLWKNLIAAGRVSRIALFISIGSIVVFGIVMFSMGDDSMGLAGTAGMLCQMGAFMILINGPLSARYDLRRDLGHLATLKSWPISGAAILRGEVLAPTIVLTTVLWIVLAASVALGGGMFAETARDAPWEFASWTVAAMIVGPGIIAMGVTIQNGIAVWLPAWVRVTPRTGAGVEGIGQQMLLAIASFLILPIVAIPAGIAGGIVWFALMMTVDFVRTMVAAGVFSGALMAECWIAAGIIGVALDKTDISAVNPA